jgi:UDPglucose 6-dehydrogenase
MIIGGNCRKSIEFANIMKHSSKKDNVLCSFMSSTEAESVKLFANTYLAMRVAFFNELDSFAMSKKLSSKNIINGVCADERIGNGYNNPSLGYGGYCLPKDTKQLRYNFTDIPESIISAIVSSNKLRKDFIAQEILKNKPSTIGFFRLVMKEGSDNFRSSAIQGIMQRVKHFGADAIIFEPNLSDKTFDGFEVISDIKEFKKRSSIIVTNRDSDSLEDVKEKCFSRDIFNEN